MTELNPDVLSAYLDGECTPDERVAIEARLVIDPAWQSELDEVRMARDAVRGLPLVDVPEGTWDAVARAIAAADAAGTGAAGGAVVPMRSSKRAKWLYGTAGAAVASVAAVVALVFVLPAPSSDQPVQPAVAAFAGVHDARAVSIDEPLTRVATASLTGPTRTANGPR